MEIQKETLTNGIEVLIIQGAIDGSTAPQLREAITEAAKPGCRLLLDMGGVHFMSSAGLRVMLLLHRQLKQGDSRVILVGMLEPIHDAMDATGFLKYFSAAPDIETAIAAFADQD